MATSRAPMPEDVLTTLRHRVEEVLTPEDVARMRLGYEVLSTLKRDALLEHEDRGLSVCADADRPPPVAQKS